MTTTLWWGTGISPGSSSLDIRVDSSGNIRVDDFGDVRVASVPGLQIINFRVDDAGDFRVTDNGSNRITEDGLLGPAYYQTTTVTSDGGQPFAFQYTTNPFQPASQGGECVFAWAHLTFSWSMSATVQVTPLVDGSSASLTLPDGSVLAPLTATLLLPQQGGNLQRVSQVFSVPLVRSKVNASGVEVGRWALRGERLQLTVESTGALGVGQLSLDGIELEYTPVRKANYPGSVVT